MNLKDFNTNYSELNTYIYVSQNDSGDIKYDLQGYAQIQVISDEAFLNETTFVTVDDLIMQANVTQPDPRNPFKCNFDFNVSLNLKFKLPSLKTTPNFTLLYKIDEFTNEVARINDDLIKALRQMGCCDLEELYNKTVVPFFRWFADHKDSKYCSYDINAEQSCGPMFGGDTFPMMLFNVAEKLLQIYLIIRPIACLARPLPGHPWLLVDFDLLTFTGFILDFFDVYYNIVVTGKIMDPLINPVKEFRKKLEYCLFGKPYWDDNLDRLDLNQAATFAYNIKKKLLELKKKKESIQKELAQINQKLSIIFDLNFKFIKSDDISFIQSLDFEQLSLINSNDKNVTFSELVAEIWKFKTNEDILKSMYLPSFDEMLDLITVENIELLYPLYEEYNFCVIGLNDPTKNHFKTFEYNDKIAFSSNLGLYMTEFALEYKDLYKTKESLLNELNQVEIAMDTLDQLIYKIENTTQSPVASEQYLIIQAQNKMNGVHFNLCNCIVYSLFPDLKIPLPETIKDFYASSFSNVKNKKSYTLTTESFQDNKFLMNLIYPNYADVDQSDKLPFNYSDGIIKEFDKEFNDALNYFISKINDINCNYFKSIKDYYEEFKGSDILQRYPAIKAYLNEVEKQSIFNYYLIYDTKCESDYVPLVGEEGDIEIQYIALENNLPENMSPTDYTIWLLVSQAYFLKLQKNIYNLELELKNKVFDVDRANWLSAKNEVSGKINALIALIQSKQLDFVNQSLAEVYLQRIQDFYNQFFRNYPEIDLLNDPHDYRVQSFYHYDFGQFTDNIYLSAFDISQVVDNYIDKRKNLINLNIEKLYNYFYLLELKKDMIENMEYNDLYTDLVWEKPDIPCTCDGIICKIIQYIINLLLSILSRLMQMLINMLIEWFMKSWVGKLIKIIIAKLKCIMMIVNLEDDMDRLKRLVDNFIEGLKGKIKLYTDPDNCLYQAVNNITLSTADPIDTITNILPEPDLPPPSDINNTSNDFDNVVINYPNPPVTSEDPTGTDTDTDTPTDTTVDVTSNVPVSIDLLDTEQTFSAPIPGYIAQGLAAKLELSDTIGIGALNERGFPILIFDCECDPECSVCNVDTKAETLQFLNEYLSKITIS